MLDKKDCHGSAMARVVERLGKCYELLRKHFGYFGEVPKCSQCVVAYASEGVCIEREIY